MLGHRILASPQWTDQSDNLFHGIPPSDTEKLIDFAMLLAQKATGRTLLNCDDVIKTFLHGIVVCDH
jgi:hypothetical protein